MSTTPSPDPARYEPLVLHREPRFEVVVLANQRPRLILKAEWDRSVGEYMLAHELTDISLNRGMGWNGGGVAFLDQVSNLRSVAILDRNTTDLTPLVGHGATLEELIVECPLNQVPRSGELPALKRVSTTWAPGWEDFFDGASHGLRSWEVQNWPHKDLHVLDNFHQLEGITIIRGKKLSDILGLKRHPKLRSLTLIECHAIEDFDAVAECSDLEHLELHCKGLRSIGVASSLTRLGFLSLGRTDIPTVAPLETCCELRRFGTQGKVTDGDLSVFLRLPVFEWAAIHKWSGYKPSVAEINEACATRYRI